MTVSWDQRRNFKKEVAIRANGYHGGPCIPAPTLYPPLPTCMTSPHGSFLYCPPDILIICVFHFFLMYLHYQNE